MATTQSPEFFPEAKRSYLTTALRLADTFSTADLYTFVFDEQLNQLFLVVQAGSGAACFLLLWPSAGVASDVSMFYGLTAGTGNATSTDYAATVAVKTTAGTGRVPFPRLGPSVGSNPVVAASGSSFTMPAGTWEIDVDVHTTETGQLQLELAGAAVDYSTAGNSNPTSGGHPLHIHALVTTTAGQVLAVINPAGNSPALTITPADGASTHAQAMKITFHRVA
jgi:hypothetical protein